MAGPAKSAIGVNPRPSQASTSIVRSTTHGARLPSLHAAMRRAAQLACRARIWASSGSTPKPPVFGLPRSIGVDNPANLRVPRPIFGAGTGAGAGDMGAPAADGCEAAAAGAALRAAATCELRAARASRRPGPSRRSTRAVVSRTTRLMSGEGGTPVNSAWYNIVDKAYEVAANPRPKVESGKRARRS